MTNSFLYNDKNINNPIGILDSGVGGLTVLSELKKIMPNENYIYYGDTKNLPYGSKTPEQLCNFVSAILNFFEQKNVKAAVLGCNTTAAVVYKKLKDNYKFPIYPIIQATCLKINPSKYKKIGIFATEVTVNSKTYTNSLKSLNKNIDVREVACPEWVNYVETNKADSEDAISNIKQQMQLMQQFKPEKIILGCTHYPFLAETLQKFTEKESLINPAKLFADFIKEDLTENHLLSADESGSCEFFVSKSPENFFKAGRRFFAIPNIQDVKIKEL